MMVSIFLKDAQNEIHLMRQSGTSAHMNGFRNMNPSICTDFELILKLFEIQFERPFKFNKFKRSIQVVLFCF